MIAEEEKETLVAFLSDVAPSRVHVADMTFTVQHLSA